MMIIFMGAGRGAVMKFSNNPGHVIPSLRSGQALSEVGSLDQGDYYPKGLL
jgi:hypothetical protein